MRKDSQQKSRTRCSAVSVFIVIINITTTTTTTGTGEAASNTARIHTAKDPERKSRKAGRGL